MDVSQIEKLFAGNFAERGELGAAVSIWKNGREIVGLAGGFCDREKTRAWTADTPVLIYSATKGPASACVLHVLATLGIPLSARVAEFWPEFAAGGKETIAVGEILSHQAGLSATDEPVPVLDYAAVIAALEKQSPLWPPGEGHGYHPRTFGFLLDEIVRRMTGETLRNYWRETFGEPLKLDTWIGLPRDENDRVAAIQPARSLAPESAFTRAFATASSLTQRAFASPRGLQSVSAMNSLEARTASFPGFGGISTARSLAKFYAMLAEGGSLEGARYFSAETIALMSTTLSSGFDKTLQIPTAFSAGFMQDPIGEEGKKLRAIFGPSPRAFGQPGAGGSVAFADPENRIAFAYVMNQMEPGALPNAKSVRMIEALYG